jgi:SAM-dependent methyltransferase
MREDLSLATCSLCQRADIPFFACDLKTGWSYFRCPVCELISRDPQSYLDAAEERSRYAQHENFASQQGYLNFLQPVVDEVLQNVSLEPGSAARGLDYGCGPGPVLIELLQSKGFAMQGYDPFFAPEWEGFAALPFDFITCTEAAEHFHHPLAEFARMSQWLKPGGHLIVMTRFYAPASSPEVFLGWFYRRDPTHVCFYNEQSFVWLAQTVGFEVSFPRPHVAVLRKH